MITRNPFSTMFNRLRPYPEPGQTRDQMFRTGDVSAPQPMGHQRFAPQPVEEEPESDESQYFNEMMRLRREGTPTLSKYREMLMQMPKEDDYKPNWMTRIAAALSGAGAGYRDPGAGVSTAMSINRSPYMNAMERYKSELGNMGEVANMELSDVSAQTKALMDARSMGLKYKDYMLKRRKTESDITRAEAQTAIDEENARTNSRRADSYGQSVRNTGNYQQGMLGVNRTNARTNARNADTNARNADTNRDRMFNEQASLELRGEAQKALNDYRKNYLDMRSNAVTGRGRPPQPRAQLEAVDLALRQLSQDPDYSDFVEDPDDTGYLTYGDDDGSPEYQVFMEELQERVENILKGQTFPPRKK